MLRFRGLVAPEVQAAGLFTLAVMVDETSGEGTASSAFWDIFAREKLQVASEEYDDEAI